MYKVKQDRAKRQNRYQWRFWNTSFSYWHNTQKQTSKIKRLKRSEDYNLQILAIWHHRSSHQQNFPVYTLEENNHKRSRSWMLKSSYRISYWLKPYNWKCKIYGLEKAQIIDFCSIYTLFRANQMQHSWHTNSQTRNLF